MKTSWKRGAALAAVFAAAGCGGDGLRELQGSLEVTPAAVDFGAVRVGRTEMQVVVLTNPSPVAVGVRAVALDPAAANFRVIEPPRAVGGGEQLSLLVEYRPVARGEETAALVIEADGEEAPRVALTGRGVSPRAQLPEPVLSFGPVPVGSMAQKGVEVRNEGDAPLRVAAQVGAGRAAFAAPDDGETGALEVPPGETRSVEVRFQPAAAGVYTGRLDLAFDDPEVASAAVELSGRGVTANLDLQPRALQFRDVAVGGNAAQEVALSNNGSFPLAVKSVRVVETDTPFSVTLDAAPPFSLDPGARVSLRVAYAPADETPDAATLVVESDDRDEPEAAVALEGTPLPICEEKKADCAQPNAFDDGRCCCWTADPTGAHPWGHVLELGDLAAGARLSFRFRPGAGDAGCTTAGYLYGSPDGARWDLLWSRTGLAGWTTYAEEATTAFPLRYVRANTDACSVDYVSVEALCAR